MEPYSRRSLAAITQAFPFSRCVFCSHPSYEARHSQKRRRYPDLRQMTRQWKKAEASRSETAHCSPDERSDIRERSRSSTAAPGFRFAHPGYKIKGSRTPTDAVRNRLPCGKRAPCRARSPVGVPRRLCPWDSPSQGATRTRLRGAGACRWRGIPPAFAPVPASTSHAGHNAGRMMSEPPGSNGDEPFARGHRTRPRQPKSPADVLHEERGFGFYSLSPKLSRIITINVTPTNLQCCWNRSKRKSARATSLFPATVRPRASETGRRRKFASPKPRSGKVCEEIDLEAGLAPRLTVQLRSLQGKG